MNDRQLLLELLRAPYRGLTSANLTRSAVCAALGHPPKYDVPPEDKTKAQKGCPCGARGWV